MPRVVGSYGGGKTNRYTRAQLDRLLEWLEAYEDGIVWPDAPGGDAMHWSPPEEEHE